MNKELINLYKLQEKKLLEMISVDKAAEHYILQLAKYLDSDVTNQSMITFAKVLYKQLKQVKIHYANICLRIHIKGGDSINWKGRNGDDDDD